VLDVGANVSAFTGVVLEKCETCKAKQLERGRQLIDWVTSCTICHSGKHARLRPADPCVAARAGLPWWLITSKNKHLINSSRHEAFKHDVPHFHKVVSRGTFSGGGSAAEPCRVIIKTESSKSRQFLFPDELWAEILFDSIFSGSTMGAPRLLGAHCGGSGADTRAMSRNVEIYLESSGDILGHGVHSTKNTNPKHADGSKDFLATPSYSRLAAGKPRAVVRGLLSMFQWLTQPPTIAYLDDMKSVNIAVRSSKEDGDIGSGAVEFVLIDSPEILAGPVLSDLRDNKKWVQSTPGIKSLGIDPKWTSKKVREIARNSEDGTMRGKGLSACRLWNVNVACRTHPEFEGAALVPCYGASFSDLEQWQHGSVAMAMGGAGGGTNLTKGRLASNDLFCASVTQRVHLLDVLHKEYFLPYISQFDPVMATLRLSLLEYVNNGATAPPPAGAEATGTLPFARALQMLNEVESGH